MLFFKPIFRYIKNVRVEIRREMIVGGKEKFTSYDFFADSWFGKNNQLAWSIFPVGR